MEFMFDLLVIPEGPRLRDKLSHGEVDLLADLGVRLRTACQLVFASMHDLVRKYLKPSSLMKIDEQVFANTPINNYAQRFFSLCDAPM
jgi:hypothetical protein